MGAAFPKEFDAFVRGFVFPHECAYSNGEVVTENVPGDDGGLTKYGIDQASHPGVDIEALTDDTAEMIYWQDFVSSDSVMLPAPLAFYHFDEVVNAGPGRENHILQAALGVDQDGELGPRTLLAAWLAWESSPNTLISALLDARDAWYRQLASNPKDSGFEDGWLNRVADLRAWSFTNAVRAIA
jgi:lysozyme family protein